MRSKAVLEKVLDRLERLEAGFVDTVAAIRLQHAEINRLKALVESQARLLLALGAEPEETPKKERIH
jgi:hypothetical protein